MTERSPAEARLLVVDDNEALCENLAEILTDAGYSVRVAHACATALGYARESFDVALVDLHLPDGAGTGLATQLMEKSPGCEVIMLTGFATVESAAAAVRAGACAYLIKPCATPELLLTVEQALRKVRLQQEKRELARRAQVAEKLAAVGTLTAGLSHEIRNPLNAAVLQLSVLERRIAKLPSESRGPLMEPLAIVRDEIRRLDHTLEDFLQFARPRELERKRVRLDQVVQNVVALLSQEALNRSVRLELQAGESLEVLAEENRLRQALVNLVINALDAAGKGSWVRVEARRAGPGRLLVRVDDGGPGIPPEIRERIFEPFFTTKASGSGLGLPIVHAIVTQHGGSIEVDNAEGGGARISLWLPEAA